LAFHPADLFHSAPYKPVCQSLFDSFWGKSRQVNHELDAVLQRVVEQDESKLVQEQARVLLRAIMVSDLV
jgi:uncharacterized protein with NRDE domain